MYWITGILGLIFIVAPFVFGYSTDSVALWTSLVVGALTLVVSIIEGAQADRQQWEYWTAGILGIIAIFAPFALGFSTFTQATWSSIVLGVLIAVFAGSRVFTMGKS